MEIAQLDEFFDVTQYQLHANAAMIALIDGDIVIKAQYVFRNAENQKKVPVVSLDMVVTQAQSNGLKAALIDILQATNTVIEAETGWTKYIEPEPEPEDPNL